MFSSLSDFRSFVKEKMMSEVQQVLLYYYIYKYGVNFTATQHE